MSRLFYQAAQGAGNRMAFGNIIDRRKTNKRNHIIDLFRMHGTLSKAQAREFSGYSMDTVIRIFSSLIRDGLITETEGEQKSRGRRALFYSLNFNRSLYLGITFNQSGIFSSLTGFSCEILDTHSSELDLNTGREEFIAAFRKHAKTVLSRNPALAHSLSGIGCSVPGNIDTESGVLHSYSFMPSIRDINFRELAGTCFPGVPVSITHNIHSMTCSVLRNRDIIGAHDLILFVSARSGAANSLVYRGDIIAGHGEMGHIKVSDEKRKCSCGKYGCLDCYFSYREFMDIMARENAADSTGDKGLPGSDGLARLAKAYAGGDRRITGILNNRLAYFTAALIDIINVTVPDLVILTGELLSVYGDPVALINKISIERFGNTDIVSHFRKSEIIYMELGTEIAAQGICYEMILSEWQYIPDS